MILVCYSKKRRIFLNYWTNSIGSMLLIKNTVEVLATWQVVPVRSIQKKTTTIYKVTRFCLLKNSNLNFIIEICLHLYAIQTIIIELKNTDKWLIISRLPDFFTLIGKLKYSHSLHSFPKMLLFLSKIFEWILEQ